MNPFRESDNLQTTVEDTLLTELFNGVYDWRKPKLKGEDQQPRGYNFKFRGDDKQLVVVMIDEIEDNEWSLSFHKDFRFDITGDGDAFKIFATVIDIMKWFVENQQPNALKFAASKASGLSRSNLYDKMLKKFSSSLKKIGYSGYRSSGSADDIFYIYPKYK